jgi:hypothetical protein
LLPVLAADCPKREKVSMTDPCGARSDLPTGDDRKSAANLCHLTISRDF